MKLVVFINSMECGGAQRVAANLANYWASKGWEITLVTTARRDNDFYELNPGVRRISFCMEGSGGGILGGLRRAVRRIMALRRVLKRVQPNVAISMMYTSNVMLASASLGMSGMNTIGSEHIYPPREPVKPAWEILRRITYRWLSAVTALTNEGASWLKANTRAIRVPVIPNAVTWPMPVQPPIVDPAGLLPADKRVLLAVGRLTAQKQYSHLIEAFGAVSATYPDWLLVILGEGPLRSVIEPQLRANGLDNRVLLPGQVGNVAHWYERADLYVMTSLYEGFPSTLAEAMAHGLPAVSYDCDTGPRDLIRHDIDGLLVPAGNTNGLIAALGRLMGDDVLRAKLATRSIETRERYSIQRITGMWEDLFAELRK